MDELRTKPKKKLSKYLLIAVAVIIVVKLTVTGLMAKGVIKFEMPHPPAPTAPAP